MEQPLVYEVNYNGAMQRVTSPNTILTFTAPSLPDGVFNGSIAVTVTAINRFGRGMPVDPEYAVISKLHHAYVVCSVYRYIITTYVQCTYLKWQKLSKRKVLWLTGFYPNVGKTFAVFTLTVWKVLKKAFAELNICQ